MVINEEASQEAAPGIVAMECDSTITDELLGIFQSIESPPLDDFSSLNDDCLRLIFKYLDVFELIAVRQLSSRFVAIVDEELGKRKQEDFMPFLLKQKVLYFNLIKDRKRNRRLTLAEAENILKCVGSFVTKIQLASYSFQPLELREVVKKTIRIDLLLGLIEKYCDLSKLSELVIWNFYMVENMSYFTSIWRNLRVLEIVNFDTRESELEVILRSSKNLTRLEVGVLEEPNLPAAFEEDEWMANNITGSCLLSQPRTIRSLTLTNCKYLNLNILCRYFEQNPQLDRFFYTKHPQNSIGILLYGQISRRLKNLRQLSIDGISCISKSHLHSSIINLQNLNSLVHLKRLKKLRFDGCGQDISLLLVRLANNESLDELTLCNATVDQRLFVRSVPFVGLRIFKICFSSIGEIFSSYLLNVSRIVHFSDLEELHLEYMNIDQLGFRIEMEKVDRGLLLLVERAPSLGRLFIQVPCIRINVASYMALLNICSRRSEPMKLVLYLSRRNIAPSLVRFLADKHKADHQQLLELKMLFCDFSYLY